MQWRTELPHRLGHPTRFGSTGTANLCGSVWFARIACYYDYAAFSDYTNQMLVKAVGMSMLISELWAGSLFSDVWLLTANRHTMHGVLFVNASHVFHGAD